MNPPAKVPGMLSKAFWVVHRVVSTLGRNVQRKRRNVFVMRLRFRALLMRTHLELEVADDVIIGRRVRVQLVPQTRAKLVLSRGVVVYDDTKMLLHSGEILIGPRVHLRSGSLLNVHGRLQIGEGSIIGWYCVVHCGSSVTLGKLVGLAERCTIADSTHYFTEPDTFFYNNTRHSPVVIGDNTWLAPGSIVTQGSDVGSHCIIGAGATVGRTVPNGHLVTAAKSELREMRLPWNRKESAKPEANGAEPLRPIH
jgi:acetyltransferase-like isoleucine patch superfamily enzyme